MKLGQFILLTGTLFGAHKVYHYVNHTNKLILTTRLVENEGQTAIYISPIDGSQQPYKVSSILLFNNKHQVIGKVACMDVKNMKDSINSKQPIPIRWEAKEISPAYMTVGFEFLGLKIKKIFPILNNMQPTLPPSSDVKTGIKSSSRSKRTIQKTCTC